MGHMLVNLKMALETDMEFLQKMMVQNMKEIGCLTYLTDWENKVTSMETDMKVNFIREGEMAKALIIMKIRIFIQANLKATTLKEKGCIYAKMEVKSKEIGENKMKKIRELFTIQTETDLKESFWTEKGMEQEYIIVKMESK